MDSEKSQEDQGEFADKPPKTKDDRGRNYAFLIYEDSACADYVDRLQRERLRGFLSPVHDKDVNPDGTQKKAHRHALLKFEGKKSRAQIDDIRRRCLGSRFNKGLEDVNNFGAYARYLCHLDNPEKAQYSRSDVIPLGGMDYDAVCAVPGDDVAMLGDIVRFILDNDVRFFVEFLELCRQSKPEWFAMISNRKAYLVIAAIKSNAARLKWLAEQEQMAIADAAWRKDYDFHRQLSANGRKGDGGSPEQSTGNEVKNEGQD